MSKESTMLKIIKKNMDKYQKRTKWWQVQKVYKAYRKLTWNRWQSVWEIFSWWWRLCPLSTLGRCSREINRLEKNIAENELCEIKELFGLDVSLYSLVEALKKAKEKE